MRASPSLANAMGVAEIPLKDLKRKYTDKQSKWIKVNGLDIHYKDIGEGPTIVLVHGIMSSLHTWNDWMDELSKTHRVIAMDVPGYGLTGAPDDADFNEEYLLSTFEAFIHEIELDKFALVGNSLGGYISAQYASSHPDKITNLILLDPVAYPQEVPFIFKLATSPGIKHMGYLVQPPLLVALTVREVYGDPRRMTRYHMDRYIQMSQRPGARKAYVKTMEMLIDRSTKEVEMPFSRITAPTLLMWGGADAWVPPKMSERWKQDISHAQVVIYPGVGHMPMEEIPEQSLADTIAFMNGEVIKSPEPVAAKSEASPAAQPNLDPAFITQ